MRLLRASVNPELCIALSLGLRAYCLSLVAVERTGVIPGQELQRHGVAEALGSLARRKLRRSTYPMCGYVVFVVIACSLDIGCFGHCILHPMCPIIIYLPKTCNIPWVTP